MENSVRPGLNGGTLRSGNPGNKGGRPSNNTRESYRALLDGPALDRITKILSGEIKVGTAIYLKTVEVAAKIGLAQKVELDPGQGGSVSIRAVIGPELAAEQPHLLTGGADAAPQTPANPAP